MAKVKKTPKVKEEACLLDRGLLLVGLGVLLIVMVVIGLLIYFWQSSKPSLVSNFQECLQAGYPLLESYPRRCRTLQGEIFVEEIPVGEGPSPEEICIDLCGDGICQEIVCLGSGCPCPETAQNCSQDCP